MSGAEVVEGQVLPRFDVTDHGSAPTHAQIESSLIDAIAGGRLKVGMKLPTEREFAEQLGVSRMTLRQALSALERRGVLVRRKGRSGGTFIAQPRVECDMTGLPGFTEQLRQANLRPGARVLLARTEVAEPRQQAALELGPDERVHHVVRIRTANDLPMSIERAWYPERHFADLLDQPLSGSIYEVLDESYGLRAHTAVEYLESISASDDDAQHLGIEPGAPLTRIERTAHSAAGQPLEFARDVYRPDRVRLLVRTGVSHPTGSVRFDVDDQR